MDEAVIKQIQREGADALLDIGVSVPLKAFHIPFRKSPLELRVTMRRPYMSGQILFARTYLSMGITSEEMWGFSKEEEMQFLASHGKAVSRMVAYTLCRGPFSRRVLLRPVAWLMGTDPFIPIIRSAERTNPMSLRLSQRKKGS